MQTFKLTLEYDGSAFNGWQVQLNAQRTVQGELEAALLKIFKKHLRVIGSGRTDTGVHARGQVAHFRVATDMLPDELMRAMNNNLPRDVVVTDAMIAPPGFHAQHSAKGKQYVYTFLNRPYPSALDRGRVYDFPRKLNTALLRREAAALLGRHDFTSFSNVDPSRMGYAVRTLSRLYIRRKNDTVVFIIAADGFLYKMVRNIVGTLLEIGCGRLPQGSAGRILAARDRRSAGKAAGPEGLCMERVGY